MNVKPKLNLKNAFKIILSLFFVSVFITNCEKDESIIQEQKGKLNLFEVSFDDFKSKIVDSKKLQKIEALTDINKAKNSTNAKIDSTSQITILTDEIKMIVIDSISTYTFEVSVNDVTENNEFYNLVIYVNNNTEEISSSHFLKYLPSVDWLADTSQQFSGEVSLINNDFFNLNEILQSKSSQDCVTGASWQWECYIGNAHSPTTPGDECGQTVFYYVLTLEYGTCTETGSLNIPPGGGSDGSTTGGGAPGNNDGIDDDEGGAKLPTSPVGGGRQIDPNAFECSLSDEDFNYIYSLNAPFVVDLSEIRDTCDDNVDLNDVIANEKFMCIYKKLTSSPKFKDLFLNTFGESDNLNVKFKTVPSIEGANGVTGPLPGATNTINNTTGEVNLSLLIEIDQSYMSSSSAIAVAKTILHECIHAYLILKHVKCNIGTPIDEILDNIDDNKLDQLLDSYYDNACPGEEQHEFMFDYMVPTMSEILADVKDDLIPENHQTVAESDNSFLDENNPTGPNVIWNWNDFYKYLSLAGLHQTDAFQWNIPVGSAKYDNYVKYSNEYGKNLFRKECPN